MISAGNKKKIGHLKNDLKLNYIKNPSEDGENIYVLGKKIQSI